MAAEEREGSNTLTYTAAEGATTTSAVAQALIEATYRVIARTETVDPPIRSILMEAGVSRQAFYGVFESKDRLLAAVLVDGRRRLAGYLAARVPTSGPPSVRVQAWVRGVLAQVNDDEAARRTRPFVAHVDRITERFPEEHRQSEQELLRQLEFVIEDERAGVCGIIYQLAFGALEWHLIHDSRPTDVEVEYILQFASRALEAVR